MGRQLIIGKSSYSVDHLRSMTEEEALSFYKKLNHPVIKPNDVKKAWKCCNGYSVPNHLKDQLKGLKPVKGEKPTEEKKVEKVKKPRMPRNKQS